MKCPNCKIEMLESLSDQSDITPTASIVKEYRCPKCNYLIIETRIYYPPTD